MKKTISWILFILTVIIFMFDIYLTVFGSMDVINSWKELDATGRGGMEYMAVGSDILVVGVAFISVIGAITAIFSAKITKSRAIRILSLVLCPLHFMLMLVCYSLLYSSLFHI